LAGRAQIAGATKIGTFANGLAAIALVGVFGAVAAPALALTENVIYSFTGGIDGNGPNGALILDGRGNLFGATASGGKYGAGVVFELSPPAAGQTAWRETVLHAFKGKPDGNSPVGALVLDSKGNLYGATNIGGDHNLGAVFELSPPSAGRSTWTKAILYSFKGGADGQSPCRGAGLIFDSSRNLYGTTCGNGVTGNIGYRNGTVFKLTPPLSVKGAWKKFILHGFAESATDGGYPGTQLTVDAAGKLYGTAYSGGSGSGCSVDRPLCGIVFTLSPTARLKPWSETILHNFSPDGVDGVAPFAGVTVDSQGNLYGTTSLGGKFALGAVYKLSPPPPGQSQWVESVSWSFSGPDGGLPAYGALISDGPGNLYGTTVSGGDGGCACGTVFEYTPGGSLHSLYSFTNTSGDGANPEGGLVMDVAGNLYGTTINGGAGAGTVFEITP
jgi:uncharacterized repeat protein (TIGR03803 family)